MFDKIHPGPLQKLFSRVLFLCGLALKGGGLELFVRIRALEQLPDVFGTRLPSA